MFFALNYHSKFLILNGGAVKKADIQDLNYYYQNIEFYVTSTKKIFLKYNTYIEEISRHVISWGGIGRIHGSIIDIGYFTHLYVNPIDGKITPYFAYSINDKYVYSSLNNMLKEHEQYIYIGYKNMINSKFGSKSLVLFNDIVKKSNHIIHDTNTDIYKISNYIQKLQKINLDHVIRMWDDKILRANSILDVTKNNLLIKQGIDEDE